MRGLQKDFNFIIIFFENSNSIERVSEYLSDDYGNRLEFKMFNSTAIWGDCRGLEKYEKKQLINNILKEEIIYNYITLATEKEIQKFKEKYKRMGI